MPEDIKSTISPEDKLAKHRRSILNVAIFDLVNQLLGIYPKDKHRDLHEVCLLHLKTLNIGDIFKANE